MHLVAAYVFVAPRCRVDPQEQIRKKHMVLFTKDGFSNSFPRTTRTEEEYLHPTLEAHGPGVPHL